MDVPKHVQEAWDKEAREDVHYREMIAKGTMSQAVWNTLSYARRHRVRDESKLNPKLRPFIGDRVEVTYSCGREKARFWVGESTGWRPVTLEVCNTRAPGGGEAWGEIATIRLIRRGRNHKR